jgi:hypothetical protein
MVAVLEGALKQCCGGGMQRSPGNSRKQARRHSDNGKKGHKTCRRNKKLVRGPTVPGVSTHTTAVLCSLLAVEK